MLKLIKLKSSPVKNMFYQLGKLTSIYVSCQSQKYDYNYSGNSGFKYDFILIALTLRDSFQN